MTQGSVLGPPLFLAYVNDIWRNIESTIRLFADDCVIYRKIINNAGIENMQKDLDRLGDLAVENAMKINRNKSKAIRFTRARLNYQQNYSLMGTLIPEASRCKYLGIILCSGLSWADQVNYTVQRAWKALPFTMRILKKGNNNTKSLAYMSPVRPILDYGGTGKFWRRVESYHAYVHASKRTLGNARGSLLVTDYKGHTI